MNALNKILLFAILLQILTCLTSPSAGDAPPPAANKSSPNVTTPANEKPQEVPNSLEVLTEGGKIRMQSKVPHLGGREGEVVLDKPMGNNSLPSTVRVPTTPSNASKIDAKPISPVVSSTTMSSADRFSIPIYENKPSDDSSASPHTAHKGSSARKGVNFTEYQLSMNASTVKPHPKKPTVTVAADEQPYMPSHFQPLGKSNSSKSQSIPKVPNFDMLTENNQGNTQKYVVPIVIVILSVPFVAILLSILYKRGSEWWKYRHYRRMDFLINGMYDN